MPVSIISSSACVVFTNWINGSCQALALTLLFTENMTEKGKFNVTERSIPFECMLKTAKDKNKQSDKTK